MSTDRFRRLLTVSDQWLRDLVTRLEASARSDRAQRLATSANQRMHQRLTYLDHNVALIVLHPGGFKSHLIVSARNLSERGIGFLHGGYVHGGSQVQIALRRLDGELTPIRGTVRSCRHLSGMIHEIGVEFEMPIDVGQYIPSSQRAAAGMHEAIRIPQLPHKIVVSDANESDLAILRHYLHPTGAEIVEASCSTDLVEASREGDVDLAIFELDLHGSDGIHAIRRIRWHQIDHPILVVTADRRENMLEEAIESGAQEIIAKPYNGPDLYERVVDLLDLGDDVEWSRCLRSTRGTDPTVSHLIPQFIEESHLVSTLLQKALESRDLPRILELCETLRNDAGRFGFQPLQDAAALTLRSTNTFCRGRRSIGRFRHCAHCGRPVAGRLGAAWPGAGWPGPLAAAGRGAGMRPISCA